MKTPYVPHLLGSDALAKVAIATAVCMGLVLISRAFLRAVCVPARGCAWASHMACWRGHCCFVSLGHAVLLLGLRDPTSRRPKHAKDIWKKQMDKANFIEALKIAQGAVCQFVIGVPSFGESKTVVLNS